MSAAGGAAVQAGCLGVLVATASSPAVLVLLRRGHVLDLATERSSHVEPTPRGGGIACVCGAMIALAVADVGASTKVLFVVTAGLFALIGLVDDLRHVRVRPRLLAQVGTAGVMTAWLFHTSRQPVATIAVLGISSVVWTVGYVNAFNFMDGIDGLAGTGAAVSGVTFAVVGSYRHDMVLAIGGAAVAGAALGFLPWNCRHARFFLGDVGSYLLGSWVAILSVLALQHHWPLEAAIAPEAVFLADAGWTLLCRVARGEDWTAPHRSHAYQKLHQLGWTHARVTTVMAVLMVVVTGLGAVSLTEPNVVFRGLADTIAVALLIAFLATPTVLGSGAWAPGRASIPSRSERLAVLRLLTHHGRAG